MKGQKYNIAGQRFGRLVALYKVDVDDAGRAKWRVRCDCGCEFDTLAQSLRHGKTKSCGCLRSEMMRMKSKHKRNEAGS